MIGDATASRSRARRCGLFVVVVVAVGCTRAPPPPPPAPVSACPVGATCLTAEQIQHAGLVTSAVVPSEGVSEVRAGGRIAFDDLRVSRVVSPLSGRVSEVNVALGQHVARHAPLLRLHAPQMGSILADAATAQADEVAAKRDYLRQRALFAEHAVATKGYEAAQNRLAQAHATAVQALQKRALLGANGDERSDTYVLRAPIEGNVIARDATLNAEVQGLADAGGDAPSLFTIGSLDTVWALGDAFAIDAAALAPGSPVEVSVTAYPNRIWHGTLDGVAATVDAATATVRVRCHLDNPGHLLKPDMTASMRIRTAPVLGLWVPQRTVFRLGDEAFVFVAEPHDANMTRFVRRRVLVAQVAADGRFLLTEGLAGGEALVIEHGIFLTGD